MFLRHVLTVCRTYSIFSRILNRWGSFINYFLFYFLLVPIHLSGITSRAYLLLLEESTTYFMRALPAVGRCPRGFLFATSNPYSFIFVFGLSKKIDIVFLDGSKILTRHSVWQKGEKMKRSNIDNALFWILVILIAVLSIGIAMALRGSGAELLHYFQ